MKKEIIKFSAPWCGPCRVLGPIVETLKPEYSDKIKFTEYNVDEESVETVKYGVTSIPTMIFLSDGEIVETVKGAVTKSALKAKLETFISN